MVFAAGRRVRRRPRLRFAHVPMKAMFWDDRLGAILSTVDPMSFFWDDYEILELGSYKSNSFTVLDSGKRSQPLKRFRRRRSTEIL